MLTQITGGLSYVTFHDGRKLAFRQLTDKDITELDEWIRECYLDAVYKAAERQSPEMRDVIIDRASRTVLEMTFYGPQGAKYIATPEGITQWIWQLSKGLPENEGLTRDQLRSYALHPLNVERWNGAFARTHAPAKNQTGPTAEAQRKARLKAKREKKRAKAKRQRKKS